MTDLPGAYPSHSAPVLDHQMFPHIFDTVLTYAPPASLLQLRATCKRIRARAEQRLSEHIEVYPVESSPYYAIRWKNAPLGPTASLAATIEASSGRGAELKNTRVVDLSVRNPSIVIDLFTATSKVDVVRIPLPPDPHSQPVRIFLRGIARLTAIRTHTLVCFSRLIALDGGSLHRLGAAPPRPLDGGLRRLVLTSFYNPSCSYLAEAEPSALPLPLPDGVEELVHILQPDATPMAVVDPTERTDSDVPLGMLNVIVQVVAQTLIYTRHCLVGVPELNPDWLNLSLEIEATVQDREGEQRRRITEAVRKAIRGEYGALFVWASEEEMDKAMERVSIMTREEYRAKVGQRQFDLETVE